MTCSDISEQLSNDFRVFWTKEVLIFFDVFKISIQRWDSADQKQIIQIDQ